MTIFSKIIPFRRGAPRPPTGSSGGGGTRPPSDSDEYARLIAENLPYIEQQCQKAVARPILSSSMVDGSGSGQVDIVKENEADELLIEVLDRLKKDDYKALREFKGTAKLSTYLTAIISNMLVDIIRSKKGRSRAKERAHEMGVTAERLYDLVEVRGFSLSQAYDQLVEAFKIIEPIERLQEMLDRMRGRATVFATAGEGDTLLVPGREVVTEEGVELIQADPKENAEELLSSYQRHAMSREIIRELLDSLTGEEKSMIAFRFPLEEKVEPKSVREIAAMLGKTEKAVDNQIRRILTRFREILMERGLALGDLVCGGDRW